MPLTDEQHKALADELSQLVKELDALDATRKTVAADFREQKKELQERINAVAEKIAQRQA